MTCPLEKQFIILMEGAGVEYTRPEQTQSDPTNLDFYLPAMDLNVEVKQWHSDRIAGQLSKLPRNAAALVLIGRQAVEKFSSLAAALAAER
jgi:hypothetical protein